MTSTQKYKTFIIHLQRALGRKDQIEDISLKSPFDLEIIDAVDGKALSKNDIENFYSKKPLYSLRYPFTLSKGEIGCFLSHRKAWGKIVDQNLEAGLIFEDDVHIEKDAFNEAISLATPHIKKLGYIQFQVRDIPGNHLILESSGSTKIIQPTVTPLRTSAQLVSKEAAIKLLNLTKKFDRPIDGLLQMHWETDIHLASIVPSGLSDKTKETGGSTLSTKQKTLNKFIRSLKREKYRYQIRKNSRKKSNNKA